MGREQRLQPEGPTGWQLENPSTLLSFSPRNHTCALSVILASQQGDTGQRQGTSRDAPASRRQSTCWPGSHSQITGGRDGVRVGWGWCIDIRVSQLPQPRRWHLASVPTPLSWCLPSGHGLMTWRDQPVSEDEQKHFCPSPANKTHLLTPMGAQLTWSEEPGFSSPRPTA